MDTNDNMDNLDDSSALPELSFDDLLEPSPMKKRKKSNFDDDDDVLESESERKNRIEDTLNTPGPKKPPVIQKPFNTTITSVRTQAVKLGTSPSNLTNLVKNNVGGQAPTSPPVLLNSKNVLPKTSSPMTSNSIKLTPKVIASGTVTSNLSTVGKTAVRTPNGQIIYIQKTPTSSNIKTTQATTVGKSPSLASSGSKPVTIQVLRTADGNYVPIKTSTAGTNGKSTTLTLSPSTMAGKKIISSNGSQLIIKSTIKSSDLTNTTSMGKTMTTNTVQGLRTVVKPMTPTTSTAKGQSSDLNKQKPITVQSTTGKPILLPNQNIVKLSPKPQTVTTTPTTAGGAVATTTSVGTSSNQVHAIPIPGKLGVQYVRVLPNAKLPAKSLNTSATPAVTASSTAVSTNTKNLNPPTSQPVKMLNAQKFKIIHEGGTPKLVVTQNKEPSTTNSAELNSNSTSKVQKTIVTVPTIKSIYDDKTKNTTQQQQQQSSLIRNNNCNTNQTIVRKHKISEINTEIQRITSSSSSSSTTPPTLGAADNAGAPEIKKPSAHTRVVILSKSNSQPKILNASLTQTIRSTTSSNSLHTHTSQINASNSSGVVQGNRQMQVIQNGKKLFTVLKSAAATEQKSVNKPQYSLLQTNNLTATTATATGSSITKPIMKPLINKQQFLQQQQKLLQIKQQLNSKQVTKTTITSSSSSSYVMPIKIKEEPSDSMTPLSHVENVTEVTSAEDEEGDSLDPMEGGVRRKHCNCSKSQCLKLYCDCFANGEFCNDCTCKDCFNNIENADERQRAVKLCLERNPNAFQPKITSSSDQADMRLHNKGCNCKRSSCLKNYCECYEAKIPCSSNCKCVGCRNVEDRPDLDMDPIDPKIMATIEMGGGGGSNDKHSLKRTYDKTQRDFTGINIKTEKLTHKSSSNYDTLTDIASPSLDRQQCNFITQEVIDATIQCMLTQADECEKNCFPEYQTEKMVMEELGRCLVEIIDFSIRNTDNSYTQD